MFHFGLQNLRHDETLKVALDVVPLSNRSNEMKAYIPGCGKESVTLTLYRVPPQGEVRPFTGQYKHLICGYIATDPDPNAYGVLLCFACAAGHGLEPLVRSDDELPK
jgi:hypothetical protein